MPSEAELDALVKELELLAAWRKPGGVTPKEKMPNTYKTVTVALSVITELRQQLASARADEQAKVVEWLRDETGKGSEEGVDWAEHFAQCIELGDHRRPE